MHAHTIHNDSPYVRWHWCRFCWRKQTVTKNHKSNRGQCPGWFCIFGPLRTSRFNIWVEKICYAAVGANYIAFGKCTWKRPRLLATARNERARCSAARRTEHLELAGRPLTGDAPFVAAHRTRCPCAGTQERWWSCKPSCGPRAPMRCLHSLGPDVTRGWMVGGWELRVQPARQHMGGGLCWAPCQLACADLR